MSALLLPTHHHDADFPVVVPPTDFGGVDFGGMEKPSPPHADRCRILVIDDNRAIHEDYRKILAAEETPGFALTEASMFGEQAPEAISSFHIDCASQGAEGAEFAERAEREGWPYAVAFVDMLMPPGLDGIETALKLWEVSPHLQVVISTAYSQESWPVALARLGHSDRLLILKKPFDPIEVQQLAQALSEKWRLGRQARWQLKHLESRVAERTCELTVANEKLREQAALLDKAQEAIFVWKLDDTVHFWNQSAAKLYDRTAEEILGQPVIPLFHSAAREFLDARRKTLAEGAWQGELPHTAADGRSLCIEARWTLVRDDFGAPESILAIHTDITEKKELAARFFRTQRLESIGTLAGGIAHDLNNVLTPIVMGIGMLKMKCADEGNLRLIESIAKSATRGAEMVRQVLSFARGAGGERRLVQPRQLIEDIQKIARDTFPKDIHCLATSAKDLWYVQGDATQLHQVLLNLAVNARDAMPAGGELVISAENVQIDACYSAMNADAKPGPHVVIEVRDCGTGIPAELLEKIFDPFFTTKEPGKGTGLGLSTSLGIVKSHGGFFQVSTESGRGTTFRLYLPAEPAAAAIDAEVPAQSVPRGHGEWILVVEDEAQIRSLTAQLLDASGYRVLTAGNGIEAVALYAREGAHIAAVFTDLMMPEMDGSTMVQVLLKMDPRVKVIAASGLSATAQDAGLTPHLRHFLPKPYTAETLLRTLDDTLHHARRAEQASGLN